MLNQILSLSYIKDISNANELLLTVVVETPTSAELEMTMAAVKLKRFYLGS